MGASTKDRVDELVVQVIEHVIELVDTQGELRVTTLLRVDTPIEVEYIRNGGILPYVLRDIISASI